jgi:NAD(P)H-hydrate epimerase
MTAHEQSRVLVEWILAECRKPLVIDADALNVCAGRIEFIRKANCPIILTPHPGEMARLMATESAAIQSDRFKWARKAAEDTHATVVLKGAGTVVVAKDTPLHISLTGNPGMATGGMGDVLCGLIAGLAAQNLKPFDAARMGVYLHGRAGDNVAWHSSQAGMIAGDVIEELPTVLRELTIR